MPRTPAALMLAFLAALASPAAAESLPDPLMTPGAADPAVTLARICGETTRHRRPPSTKLCDAVFAAYSISPADRYSYECNHLIPVALAGATVAENLWPQPNAEAERKDRLKAALQRQVCAAPPEAQAAMLLERRQALVDDWVAAERRFGR